MKRTPKPSAYIPTTIALLVLGFGGLMIIMNATDPLLGARWLFFLLVVVAFTGVALPASAWLNGLRQCDRAPGPVVRGLRFGDQLAFLWPGDQHRAGGPLSDRFYRHRDLHPHVGKQQMEKTLKWPTCANFHP
jgi:hypothetical protein